MSKDMRDTYRFSNLKGSREEWMPPLTLTPAEFWDRVRGCHAVFIPACYWRSLDRQETLVPLVKSARIVSSGNYPVSTRNGVHVYSNAFTSEDVKGFGDPIILVHPVQAPHYD